jgi:ribulose 1,5-bisphosphate carboxylase large subunit-like protein
MKNGTDELVTILVLGIIAVVALSLLKVGGKDIAIAIGGGLIGYLKGHSPGPERGRDEV